MMYDDMIQEQEFFSILYLERQACKRKDRLIPRFVTLCHACYGFDMKEKANCNSMKFQFEF